MISGKKIAMIAACAAILGAGTLANAPRASADGFTLVLPFGNDDRHSDHERDYHRDFRRDDRRYDDRRFDDRHFDGRRDFQGDRGYRDGGDFHGDRGFQDRGGWGDRR